MNGQASCQTQKRNIAIAIKSSTFKSFRRIGIFLKSLLYCFIILCSIRKPESKKEGGKQFVVFYKPNGTTRRSQKIYSKTKKGGETLPFLFIMSVNTTRDFVFKRASRIMERSRLLSKQEKALNFFTHITYTSSTHYKGRLKFIIWKIKKKK